MRRDLPANQYLRMIENRFTSSESAFVSLEAWDRIVDPQLGMTPVDLFLPIWVGVDASTKRDSTAIVAVTFDQPTHRVRLVYHRIFQPSVTEPLDFELTVESTLRDLAKRFQLRAVRFDPYQLAAVMQRLSADGIVVEEYPQTPDRLTAMAQNLYDLISGRALTVYPSEAIRTAISRTVASESGRGWKLDKTKQSHKIDVVVSLAMACHAAVSAQGSFDRSWSWLDGNPIGATPQSAEQHKAQAARSSQDFYAARLQAYLLSGGHGNGALPFTRDGVIDWGRLPRGGFR